MESNTPTQDLSDNFENNNRSHKRFNLPEIIFIALLATINVATDILVSPAFIALTTHIVSGLLIMVPVNFIFLMTAKKLVPQFGSLALYMTVFGTIATPLTFWGNVAGIWKILLGFIIGILLDLVFSSSKAWLQIVLGGVLGSIIWWIPTFVIWQLLGLPSVQGMSLMLKAGSPVYNGWIDLSTIMNLPITEVNGDLIIFGTLCGLISAIPVMVSLVFANKLTSSIKETTVFQRFQNYR